MFIKVIFNVMYFMGKVV